MAKGPITGEIVIVSPVRTGYKRELQFVLKSQSEICGGESLGRTRGSKSNSQTTPKKMRLEEEKEDKSIVEEEEEEGNKSDVVDIDEGKETEEKLSSVSFNDAKLEKCLVNAKPSRRLTRSMLKSEDIICVDASTSLVVRDEVVVDDKVGKPLRRITRSLVQQEIDSDGLNLDKNSNKEVELVKVEEEVETNDAYQTPNKSSSKPEELVNVEEEVEINDVEMDDDDDIQSPLVTTTNERGGRSFPKNLKELLHSRVLDGLTVYYLKGAKMREAGARGLKGVIQGLGVLCFCSSCKGIKVVSAAVFEMHAFSTKKRPPEYILLESGSTLRDVMNACKETPLDTLEDKLRLVVGPNLKKSSVCFNCQGQFVEPCDTKSLVLCKLCLERKEPEVLHASPSKASDSPLKGSPKSNVAPKSSTRSTSSPDQSNNRRVQPSRKSAKPCVVKETVKSESKPSSSKSNSQGKLTRKDIRLHKLVFEDDILPDGTEVGYFVAGKKLLVGYKKGFGIHCSCCNKVVSPSSFEAHAGCASRRKPFQHIYTTNGVSLHELSVVLTRDQRFSIRENDDLCTICKDGGDLLCCDTCPRSYHRICANLPTVPSDKWSCKYCVNMVEREKFVDSNLNAIAAGRVHGVDAIAQITQRCIRIVSSLGCELPSVCVLCRGHSFCKMGFNSRTVIICDQCEKEFHVGCLKEHDIDDLKELPEGEWFCSVGCKKINTSLNGLVAHGEEKLSSNFLNFIKEKQKANEEDENVTPDVRWKVLNGKLTSDDDTKALLAKAVSILHERFDPISETGTRGDLIPAMVYGRETKAQDFSGMYCTMLIVDEVVVSVGIFRVFGTELAELPLVATSKDCQGQGYFQCLFACIQRLLGFLNVKHLVLPAADEAKSIWTDKFGFSKMTDEEVNEYRKDFSVMVFHGTSMLRKTVPDPKAVSKPEEGSMEQ